MSVYRYESAPEGVLRAHYKLTSQKIRRELTKDWYVNLGRVSPEGVRYIFRSIHDEAYVQYGRWPCSREDREHHRLAGIYSKVADFISGMSELGDLQDSGLQWFNELDPEAQERVHDAAFSVYWQELLGSNKYELLRSNKSEFRYEHAPEDVLRRHRELTSQEIRFELIGEWFVRLGRVSLKATECLKQAIIYNCVGPFKLTNSWVLPRGYFDSFDVDYAIKCLRVARHESLNGVTEGIRTVKLESLEMAHDAAFSIYWQELLGSNKL